MANISTPRRSLLPLIQALIPLLALALMLSIFAFGNPLALFRADVPLAESLNFERVQVVPDGFDVTLVNDGPGPVTIAQVTVDDAYWEYEISPSATLPRFGRARLHIAYHWVRTEPYDIGILTSSGLTFTDTVDLAVATPTPGLKEFAAYGLLGVYVGIIPVGLGMLWFPAMRRMGRKWLGALLALTVGLLVFLLIDTFLEALEVAQGLPGFIPGTPMILLAALLTWLLIAAIGSRRRTDDLPAGRSYLAGLIALGIGLHNLGEGLAIGAAFSLGEAALGSFLVIGFTLHNITEGIGIVAPLVPKEGESNQTGAWGFVGLALLAGAPAILGAWIGGFAYSPLLATLFLGIGLGAIWQVIVEVGRLLRSYSLKDGMPLISWPNVTGFALGLGLMYATAMLVAG